ncbi:hypothetical protein HNQ95_004650 [Aminobacter ciceronei]|uniref:Rap1a immunity protein domain-containing protein n=1 Tax=Aminobacter ciceronei TaxID=150723 RepID=A0ABR6CDP5_9HYPH|nr:hypothetical protein [Aminobacter ciceronei]MBA9022665.1 hypothetical protein [Aminobacter ciceronei]
MLRCFTATLVILFLQGSNAYAKTGAELLQDNEMYGLGFVWGAANYMVEDYALNDDVGNRLTMHRAKCLYDAGMTARVLYDSVMREIRSDPGYLSKPATHALQVVTYKICGAPPAN